MESEQTDIANNFNSEKIVGIVEFLNVSEPIKGVMKYRYTDFIVNEIDYETKEVLFFPKELNQ
jgi:hypothetical protein